MGTKNNSGQTNTNQAALAQQQYENEQLLAKNQATATNAIIADLGTPIPDVPAPRSLPSVSAIIGPDEGTIMRRASIPSAVTSAGEAAFAVDPNETGIINTFVQSAQGLEIAQAQEVGGGTSAQGIGNPLGPQVTYAELDPTTMTTATSGVKSPGSTVAIIAALAAGGGFLWYKMHHAHGGHAA